MITLEWVFLLLVCLWGVEGGTCPKYPIITDFDFSRYLGLWYQQDKKQAGWEAPGRCWKALYLRDNKSGQFKLRMIFQNSITRREEKYDSQLTLQGPTKPSFIKYSIPLTFLEDEFQVLATDYETFAVEYKCDPNGILDKQESVFLMTREKNPSPLVLQRAYAIMHRYGIDIRKLERVDQTCGGLRLPGSPPPKPGLSEYDEYPLDQQPPQELTDNRRLGGLHEGMSASEYQQAVADEAPVEVAEGVPFLDKINHHRPPPQRKFFPDRRITLGQSLATKLWHVLHGPSAQ